MRFFLCLICLLAGSGAQAQDKYLHIELAEPRVDITTGFNGTRVVLFGTTNEDEANIAVTLQGPETTSVVRKKGRVAGMWVNRDSLEFRRVPSYYDYAVRFKDIGLLSDTDFLNGNHIGVDNLAFYPEDADEDPAIVQLFKDALIRRMQEKGFYPLRAGVPEFLDSGFFKVVFDLPPGVPTGIYMVEAILVKKNGEALSRQSKTIRVGQVGFNARIYALAAEHALLYGCGAVLIALVTGWSAFTFLRRD